jgi:hypothetical protein
MKGGQPGVRLGGVPQRRQELAGSPKGTASAIGKEAAVVRMEDVAVVVSEPHEFEHGRSLIRR